MPPKLHKQTISFLRIIQRRKIHNIFLIASNCIFCTLSALGIWRLQEEILLLCMYDISDTCWDFVQLAPQSCHSVAASQ